MGAGGNEREKLELLLNQNMKKFEDIINFYKNEIQSKNNEIDYNKHSIIILLTLREMEITKNLISKQEQFLKFPQFSLELKKVYNMKFKGIVPNSSFVNDFNQKINNYIENFKKIVNINKLNKKYNVSVIDDLITPSEKHYLFLIIEDSWKINFHQFFLDFIYKEIFANNKYNITEYLPKLYMIKYMTQILIFSKEWIQYTINLKDNENANIPLTKEEMKKCKQNAFNEEIIMTLSLFQEISSCNKENIKNNNELIKDNEKALNELIELYKRILGIINKLEIKKKNNNNLQK